MDVIEETTGITKELRQRLRRERARTGITALMLMDDRCDAPDGLSGGVINRWIAGLAREAPKAQVEYVLMRWEGLPARAETGEQAKRGRPHAVPGSVRIPLTREMSAHLRAEFARTRLDAAAVLNSAVYVPPALNPRVIRGWLYGEAATVDAGHWRLVTAQLEKVR